MDSHKFLSLTTFFLLFQLFQVSGQSLKVTGHVHADDGTALSGVSISLRGIAVGTATRDDGSFELSSLSEGRFTMTVSSVGYIGQSKDFTLKSGQDLVFEFVLKSDAHSMEEALILGKTEAQQLKETGFNVNAIDVKAFANSNWDINQILNASSGIRIRENGGLGSDFNFSMNGLSGRQVKFFIDGIPMENFGGAMSLNNIPVNLAERIEIYKGVVPAELGADALGGAVNIVTAQNTKRFLDASYSYGSFNMSISEIRGQAFRSI